MANPNSTTQEIPITQKIYNSLSNDDNYKNRMPDSYEVFMEKMADPDMATKVYNSLTQDEKYKAKMPKDTAVWINTFAPVKKKDDTQPPSETTTPVSETTSEVSTGMPEVYFPGYDKMMKSRQTPTEKSSEKPSTDLSKEEKPEVTLDTTSTKDPITESIKEGDKQIDEHIQEQEERKPEYKELPEGPKEGQSALDYLESGPLTDEEQAALDRNKRLTMEERDARALKDVEAWYNKEAKLRVDALEEDLQAELDAGNISEDEANANLQDGILKIEQDLNAEADTRIEQRIATEKAEMKDLEEQDFLKSITKEEVAPPDAVSRITARKPFTEKDKEEAQQYLEKRKNEVAAFNAAAKERLEAIQPQIQAIKDRHAEERMEQDAKDRENQPWYAPKYHGQRFADEVLRWTDEDKVIYRTADVLERLASMSDEETAGFLAGIGDQGMELLPIVGSVSRLMDIAIDKKILEKNQDERTPAENEFVEALALLNGFEAQGMKPNSYELGEIVGMMIPVIGEFALTAGGGTAAARWAGTKLLRAGLKRNALNYTLRGVTGATAQASMNQPRIIADAFERMTPVDAAILDMDSGEIEKIIRVTDGASGLEGYTKAYFANVAEVLSERLGLAMGAGKARFMKSAFAKKLLSEETIAKWMISEMARRKGISTATGLQKVLGATGIQGFITEYGEEYFNQILNEQITGDRGITFAESLNPLSKELIKGAPAIALMSGMVALPRTIASSKKLLDQYQAQKQQIKREEEIKTIRNGSVINLENKDGSKRRIVRKDGVWKQQQKNGVWRTLPEKDQGALDNLYVEKRNEKKDGTTKEKRPKDSEQPKDGQAPVPPKTEEKQEGDKPESEAPSQEEGGQQEIPSQEEGGLKEDEQIITRVKPGETITFRQRGEFKDKDGVTRQYPEETRRVKGVQVSGKQTLVTYINEDGTEVTIPLPSSSIVKTDKGIAAETERLQQERQDTIDALEPEYTKKEQEQRDELENQLAEQQALADMAEETGEDAESIAAFKGVAQQTQEKIDALDAKAKQRAVDRFESENPFEAPVPPKKKPASKPKTKQETPPKQEQETPPTKQKGKGKTPPKGKEKEEEAPKMSKRQQAEEAERQRKSEEITKTRKSGDRKISKIDKEIKALDDEMGTIDPSSENGLLRLGSLNRQKIKKRRAIEKIKRETERKVNDVILGRTKPPTKQETEEAKRKEQVAQMERDLEEVNARVTDLEAVLSHPSNKKARETVALPKVPRASHTIEHNGKQYTYRVRSGWKSQDKNGKWRKGNPATQKILNEQYANEREANNMELEKLSAVRQRIAEMKERKRGLEEALGDTKRVYWKLDKETDTKGQSIFSNVTTERQTTKKGEKETNYRVKFTARTGADVDATLREMVGSDGRVLYQANTSEVVSEMYDNPTDALKEVERRQPRIVTQTTRVNGLAALSWKGEPLSGSMANGELDMKTKQPKNNGINALRVYAPTARIEVAPREAGATYRKVKIFFSDKPGDIFTLYMTTKGKWIGVNKKTGEPNANERVNLPSLKKKHPFIHDLIQGKAEIPEPTMRRVIESDQSIDWKTKNAEKFSAIGQAIADKLEKLKVKEDTTGTLMYLGINVPKAGKIAWNTAIDVAKFTLKNGGRLIDALRAAAKALRNSDWYNSLSGKQKADFSKKLEDEVTKVFVDAGISVTAQEMEAATKKLQKQLEREHKVLTRDKMRDLIFNRRAAIATAAYRTRVMVEHVNMNTTKLEREILPFIIEGTDVPKALGRPDLMEEYAAYKAGQKPHLDKIAADVKDYNDIVWKQMKEGAKEGEMDEGYIEDYITHIWDIPKNKTEDVISHFTTDNQWTKKRYIETLKEGIERFQLKPRMLDVGEILTIHGSTANNVQANKAFLEGKFDENGKKVADGLKDIRINGKRLVVSKKDVPSKPYGYTQITGVPKLRDWWVHKDVKGPLEAVWGKKFDPEGNFGRAMAAIDWFNNTAKGIQLTVSLFHHYALIEAGIPLLGLKGGAKLVGKGIGQETLWRSMNQAIAWAKGDGKKKLSAMPYAYQNGAGVTRNEDGTLTINTNPHAQDALLHGVQLGSTEDIRVKEIENVFAQITKLAGTGTVEGSLLNNLFTAIPKSAEKVIQANNIILWEYLHDNLKIMAFTHLSNRYIKEGMTPDQIRKRKIEIGRFVNDSFGGQNWDVLGIRPIDLQGLRILLLSPDWTISTIRQAAPAAALPLWLPVRGINKMLGGKGILGHLAHKADKFISRKMMKAHDMETAPLRAVIASKFWARVGVGFGLFYTAWNGFNRYLDMEENPEYYTEEERKDWESLMMWKNSPGHMTHVFGGRYADGQEKYLRTGKQFRELPEFFLDELPGLGGSFPKPMLKKIGGKMSPVVQFASKTFTGKSPSGFEDYDLKDKESWEWTEGWLKMTAKTFSPFAMSNIFREDKEWEFLDLIFPTSKGMSMKKATGMVVYFMGQGDIEGVRDVFVGAKKNNLSLKQLMTLSTARYNTLAVREIEDAEDKEAELIQKINTEGASLREIEVWQKQLQEIQMQRAEKLTGMVYGISMMTKWIEIVAKEMPLDKMDFEEIDKMATAIEEMADMKYPTDEAKIKVLKENKEIIDGWKEELKKLNEE